MRREDANVVIKGNLKRYLEEQGIDTKKNFTCKTRRHEDNNPSMAYYTDNHVYCFSCEFRGDIFDLIGFDYGLSNYRDIFKKAYELYGVKIDDYRKSGDQMPKTDLIGNREQVRKNDLIKESTPKELVDYSTYLKDSISMLKNNPKAMNYLRGRGLSLKTIQEYKLGYDEAFIHPTNTTVYPSKRIIIADKTHNFTARSIDNNKVKYFKVGMSNLYNDRELNRSKPVFITEGEFDALSVIEVGGKAVALGSVNNVNKMIKRLRTEPPKAEYLVLALDNDQSGERATSDLMDFLGTTDILHLRANISGQYKDINDCLISDRKSLEKAVMELSAGYLAAMCVWYDIS